MDLEKIEDRLAKATEHSGKWYLSETEHGGLGIFRDPDKYEPFYPILIAEIADPDIAEFLCFAPEDTRSLINRVQRLEQELEAMKALHVSTIQGCSPVSEISTARVRKRTAVSSVVRRCLVKLGKHYIVDYSLFYLFT